MVLLACRCSSSFGYQRAASGPAELSDLPRAPATSTNRCAETYAIQHVRFRLRFPPESDDLHESCQANTDCPVCGFAKIHSESTFFVLSRCCRRIMPRSRSRGSGFAEPSVLVSSTLPATQDRAIEIFEFSQSTSLHFSPAISLTRGPKNKATKSIVRNGSVNLSSKRLNSLIVKILGTFVRLEEPFTRKVRHSPNSKHNGKWPPSRLFMGIHSKSSSATC